MSVKSYQANVDSVVDYLVKHSITYSEAQKWLIEKTLTHSMNRMLSSGDEMHLLANICRAIGAKKTLDIGVYTGYSALTIASVLPDDGKLFALDVSDEYLKEFCEPAWEMEGVNQKIEFFKNSALVTLENLIETGHCNSFDFAFIDADKENYAHYFEACMKLVRPGGLIAIDNVLWGGRVIDPNYRDATTKSIQEFNRKLKDDDRIHLSMIRIGDGVSMAFKK